ncbi:MAG TPA: hypothetical protein VES02_17525 [Dermatophilaceae bacterium]|nr:hypothetical protein [Dermatophilaceae bacterium]
MTGSLRRVAALTAGLMITMTACSSGSDGTDKLEPRVQRMIPTGAPSVAVKARDGQPAESRQVSGKFFSMYVPANFQEKSVPMASGEQMVRFDAPSSKPASPVRIVIGPDTKSRASAIEQSMSLEIVTRQDGGKDLTRSTLKWPGVKNAILIQWTETPAGAGLDDAPLRYWQIMAQVNDHLIVSLLAMAPVGEFNEAGLAKIVETFRPHA